MGFSHYWYRVKVLEQEQYNKLAADVQFLLAHLPEHSLSAGGYYANDPLKIEGAYGLPCPEITDQQIVFNGAGENEDEDLGHESFDFPRVFVPEKWDRIDRQTGMWFQFCKTARKPYDLLVCAVLLAAKHHFPAMKVKSDGSPRDWQPATEWYMQCFPEREPGF